MAKSTRKTSINPKDVKLTGSNKLNPVQELFKVNGTLPESDLFRHPECAEFIRVQTSIAPHPRPIDISTLTSPADNKAISALLQTIPMQSLLVKHHLSDLSVVGNSGVVAILDTGVNAKHQDLVGKVIYATNYAGETSTSKVADLHGHGTHMAGIICGTSRSVPYTLPQRYARTLKKKFILSDSVRLAVGGINTAARIVSIKVTEGGAGHSSWSNIADGLFQVMQYNNEAADADKITCVLIAYNGFDNVNKSEDLSNERMVKYIAKLYKAKIPVVVSAGNMYELFATGIKSDAEGVAYPAYAPDVLIAGALTADNNITEFSQRIFAESDIYSNRYVGVYGDQTVAPGIGNKKSYTLLRGSSVSAAVLAGGITLLQSRYSATHDMRSLPLNQMLDKIMQRSGRTLYQARATARPIKTFNLNGCLVEMDNL